MMTSPKSLIYLAVPGLLCGLLFRCLTPVSGAESLEEVRSRVTIEQAYAFGTEIQLVARKGDIVRLALNENPTGRKEMFLLPKKDMLEWRLPSRWNTGTCSIYSRTYGDSYLGSFFGTMLNLRCSEGPDDNVTIKLLINDGANLEPRSVELLREEVRKREEERRKANVISIDERISGFARLWSEVKYNFAFFDQVPELDWDKVLEEYLPKIRKAQTTEEYYRLLEQCVARLKDGHTTVYPPGIFRSRAGLPVRLRAVEGKPIISEVAEAASFW